MTSTTRRQLIAAVPAVTAAATISANLRAAASPTYPNTPAGLAGSIPGQAFAVDNDDGTVTVYVNKGGDAVAQFTLTTTAALSAADGAGKIGFTPDGRGATTRPTDAAIRDLGQNLKSFGEGVGTGSARIDTAAWQAALASLASTGSRKLIVPVGEYLIEDTLLLPANLSCIEIVGQGGYDGIRGPINQSLFTSLKWVGRRDPTAAVVRFDQSCGCVWRGISIDCNYRAGFGLQFMSSSHDTGSIKNIIERCSIHYALRDGIIVGEWGDPAVGPGARQFFGNRFSDLTFYGCGQSAIHINEWNADQQVFDNVMVYLDDAPSPQHTLNAFWFDAGGQHSLLQNCQSGGLSVVPGIPSSGYMIRNEKSDQSIGGAFGLTVVNCWQEGEGGLYYGVTSTNDNKAFKFERCASFTNDKTNRSVYIDKGTSSQIPYTFDTCTFFSDVEIASDTFRKESLSLINCIFSPGKGVIDFEGNLTTNGLFEKGRSHEDSIVLPRFADLIRVTLNENVNSVFANGISKKGDKITLLVTQDDSGKRTINFASSGNFSDQPTIPQPNTAPNSTTVYSFISDGSLYYLVGIQGLLSSAIANPVGGTTVDVEARHAINLMLAQLRFRDDFV
ncbi:MAG: hypothetical protein J7493_13005 [Porphyrobacter sp.]|nr:hypothetical protein [Porphyrobacter sp.]